MKIIITGSLGNISKPLAEELVQKGHSVTVISSHQDRQQDIEAIGATAAIGSVEDVEFLTAKFSGADAVYAMIPPNFAAKDPLAHYEVIGKSYAKAIQQAGVKRVVQLSSWGAHLTEGTGFIVGSHRVEVIMNELSDVAITYLRPCSFYNNLYHYTDMIKQVGFIGTNFGGEDKVTLVSTQDIAGAAAEELQKTTTGKNIRYVASDEHTCNEIASILGAAIGQPDMKWLLFTGNQVKEALEKTGMPAAAVDKMVELNLSIHNGKLREDYDLHQPAEMGKVKLEDFAKEFAAAFKK
ncbi:NAD(P)H-binding protein [Pedobacter sp. L105]|uniref:NAD(P)H-binding protein n=1 Tax=Pedobacter sp. L105 TaxID=1641871 RepID=UPI00131D7C2E|nr:NAD(P)H-binding protein [Pedobacter sp. L105]